jgi:hypothetical protein
MKSTSATSFVHLGRITQGIDISRKVVFVDFRQGKLFSASSLLVDGFYQGLSHMAAFKSLNGVSESVNSTTNLFSTFRDWMVK